MAKEEKPKPPAKTLVKPLMDRYFAARKAQEDGQAAIKELHALFNGGSLIYGGVQYTPVVTAAGKTKKGKDKKERVMMRAPRVRNVPSYD